MGLKFGEDVLVEIVAIIQDALINGKDASDGLREIEVDETKDAKVCLSTTYLRASGRTTNEG